MLPVDFARLPRLTAVACGTAYLAGLVGKYWFEQVARLPVDLDIASEFRYREPPLDRGGVTLVISQSGETLDTLAALHEASPSHELVFLLGADALADLPNWHEAARISRLVLLGATTRGGERPADSALDALLPGLSARVAWFQMPRIDISATDLRRRASEGRSLRYLVPPAVEAYIEQHQLYRPS